MFNCKQLFSKSLIAQCRNTFSGTRVRNFFEVDPIFPDFNDPDRHIDIKRFSFTEATDKEMRQKRTYYESTIAAVNQKEAEKVNKRKRREELKRQAMSVKEEKEQSIQKLADTILTDPDMKLPYGFGFDEYINKLKERNLSSANDAFLRTLNALFDKLNFSSDMELIEFHRDVIVQKSKGDFKERARAIILDNLIKEINAQRANKTGNRRALSKVIRDEKFLDETLSGESELTADAIRDIEGRIDAESIDNAAENLANQAITRRIALNRAARKKRNRQNEGLDIIKVIEESPFKTIGVNNSLGEVEEMKWMEPVKYARETLRMDDEEFTRFQVVQEISNIRTEKRDKFAREVYNKSRDLIEGELPFEKEKYQKTDESNEFFNSLNVDKKIADLEHEVGIFDRDAPSYQKIYADLDKVLANAPLSVKSLVAKHHENGNTTFKPQFANLAINPQEFFWGEISQLVEPVIPEEFRKSENLTKSSLDEVMEAKSDKPFQKKERPSRFEPKVLEDVFPEEYQEEVTFDVSELTPEMHKEIEIFKHVRNEPFYRHYLMNELRYYTDRMNDHFALLYAGVASQYGARANDFNEFDLPESAKIQEILRQEAKIEPTTYHGKSFGHGTRKTATALAIVSEGTGKITINKKHFIEYFGQVSLRDLVVDPLMVSGYSVGMDVKIFIWGGGSHAQAEAAALAVSRAIVRFNPGVKKTMRENGMLNLDVRQVERKKVGLYKARAKYPYSRR